MKHLLILALLASCQNPAEPAIDDTSAALSPTSLDPQVALDHLAALQQIADAHDDNRAVGTTGYDASVAYVRGVLDDLGLDVQLEPVSVVDWRIEGGAVTWGEGALATDQLGAMRFSPGGSVSAPVTAVDVAIPPADDANTSTSGCEASDFEAFTAGHIALIQRGTCTFSQKVANAEAAGALAVLVFNEGQVGRQDAVNGDLDDASLPTIPVLGLSYAAGVELSTLASPITVDVDATLLNVASDNVIATLPGTSGRTWVLGAHLDSVPEGPGINDNGTGVATLLSLAARLASEDGPPTHDVQFAFWAAEEVGLVGSLAHVRAMSEDQVRATLGYLNYDMVGSPNAARFIYDGDGSTFEIAPFLQVSEASIAGSGAIEALFQAFFDERGLAHDPVPLDGRSDYLGFASVGIPTGGPFTGAESLKSSRQVELYGGVVSEPFDACYHLACDNASNVDAVVLAEMGDASWSVLQAVLAADPALARTRTRPVVDPKSLPMRVPLHDHGAHSLR